MGNVYNFSINAKALECVFKFMSFGFQFFLKIRIGTLLDIRSQNRCRSRFVIPESLLLCTQLGLMMLCLFSKFYAGNRCGRRWRNRSGKRITGRRKRN